MRRTRRPLTLPRGEFVEMDVGMVQVRDVEVHGNDLMEPIGFLRFPSQYKPAKPTRKPATRRRVK